MAGTLATQRLAPFPGQDRDVLDAEVGERRAGRPLGGHGGVTLGQRLDRVMDSVEAGGSPDCPVCRGPMVAGGGGARCDDCGCSLT